MPYSNFSIEEVKNKFDLQIEIIDKIIEFGEFKITDWLQETLTFNFKMTIRSEKSRNELIVMPVLLELKRHIDDIYIFSGERLDVDKSLNLNGECDFIITKTKSYIIESPIFVIIEAKKQDLDGGIGQCIAQLIGAQKLNKNTSIVYGCVTTGEEWQFIKLEKNIVSICTTKYWLDRKLTNLESILSIFYAILTKEKEI